MAVECVDAVSYGDPAAVGFTTARMAKRAGMAAATQLPAGGPRASILIRVVRADFGPMA